MRVIFVRHGYPNYEKDCLTDVGHLHAQAAAERLADEPFSRVFSSTCGRAVETAEHIAAKHDLPVESFDFMREITWGPIEGETLPHKNGYPWVVSAAMVAEGAPLMDPDWMEGEYFSNNSVKFLVETIGIEFDKLLATLGFERDGLYYRVTKENGDTVAMVSHGGSSAAALAHLLNLPFPFLCENVRHRFTAITILGFNGKPGDLISPRIEILNDSRHIIPIGHEVYVAPKTKQ